MLVLSLGPLCKSLRALPPAACWGPMDPGELSKKDCSVGPLPAVKKPLEVWKFGGAESNIIIRMELARLTRAMQIQIWTCRGESST